MTQNTAAIEIATPDDWHVHFRDGPSLRDTVPHTARQFGRALVMPNLQPPVTLVAQALAYRERIRAVLPPGATFEPLMALYLRENTTPEEIKRAHASPAVLGCKLYPAGATTHSALGVTDLAALEPVFAAMQALDVPLMIHGESTDPAVDVFDREAVFIQRALIPLIERFPRLRIVLEHITTTEAVDLVREGPDTLAATITAHHLRHDRNALFAGGLRPHYYCLPVLKRESHRQALIAAASSGHPRFFLGTDSAPHAVADKESACGCAGIFTAPAALEYYAEVFEQAGALARLEGFASHHGADFYRLPRNAGRVRLVAEPWEVPARYAFGGQSVIPLGAGTTLRWRLAD